MGGLFDLNAKKEEILTLEGEQTKENFWNDIENANSVNQKLSNLKKEITLYETLQKDVNDTFDLLNEDLDEDTITLITESIAELKTKIDEVETSVILSGEFDSNNCYLEIHPGAGGTESCDWASMLERMYERFCEKNGFTYEIIDYQKGDEAGIKSVTLKIKGMYAYGYLKYENGIHRLVRKSPFDAGNRRHTSFASVSIMPEVNTNIDIIIKEEDLKIDVYHSSGAGGQSVNTSNSAVRITHLPTKTVVTCQVERSQLKNKERAMQMLKNKLYLLELEKKNEALANLKGESKSINFGSQIRSYVLEPYKLVKDHRTNYENTNPDKILDGSILDMLIFNLKELR